ncbi:tetratricopeptide repeat protein [Flavobacterium rhizosphaerae]|uniref:Tetratricopeptide repeat protein n=1 Tax=Flavobacterium rhizosphaerae TaxID=3163298 RepID=A0ABW8YWV7_9FLAO
MKKIIIPILIITAVFTSCHKRVTETDRTTAVGYANKANLYRGQGKVDSAEFFFQKAFALDKNNIKYRYTLMGIYSEQKKFDKAFELLEGTPESEKNSVFYFQAKGSILDLQGKYDLAQEEYLKAYKISKAIDVKK